MKVNKKRKYCSI